MRATEDSVFPGSTPGYVPFAGARVYNEAAFRQFLAADWARAERLRRCLLLVLVSIRHESTPVMLSKSMAASVFRGLSASVREVDFVGWFREGRVAAALLAQGPISPDASARASIAARVGRAIEERLPSRPAGSLCVRVHRLGVDRSNVSFSG